MPRIARTLVISSGILMLCASCGQDDDGQRIDVASFDQFSFNRTIEITQCFTAGDLLSVNLTSQADNRLLTYTMLTVGEGEGAATQPDDSSDGGTGADSSTGSTSARWANQSSGAGCLAVTDEGECLVAGETTTRVLVQSENQQVDELFSRIMIANEPIEFCAAGNVTLCSEDLYVWDGLTASADFCQPVHVRNAYEVMTLLEDLRDGPPSANETSGPAGDSGFTTRPVQILRTEQFIASDQILGKNGDYVVLRSQSDLNGVLQQDGTAAIDFATETGIAAVVIRAPCQEFTGLEGTESALTIDVRGTLARDQDCTFDLGSIDAWLIVIPKTPKLIRLFLNNSELDEIHL